MHEMLLLVAHGSRDPAWAGPVRELEARLRAALPGLQVQLAFLEHASPQPLPVAQAAARSGLRRLWLAPLLLGAGTHARCDIADLAAAIGRGCPGMTVQVLPILGELEGVLSGIAAALSAAVSAQGTPAPPQSPEERLG
jgi:sirohydrochlorin cobaltochelatase